MLKMLFSLITGLSGFADQIFSMVIMELKLMVKLLVSSLL